MGDKIITSRLEVEKIATDTFVRQNSSSRWMEFTDDHTLTFDIKL